MISIPSVASLRPVDALPEIVVAFVGIRNVVRRLSYKGSGLSIDGVPMHNLNSIYEAAVTSMKDSRATAASTSLNTLRVLAT